MFKVQVAGQYVAAGRVTTPARTGRSRETAKKLWAASCELTGLVPSL